MTTNSPTHTHRLTIDYPDELLGFTTRGVHTTRLLLAIKLYETGKLTTGLAAKLAGVSRNSFFILLGQYGLSPFSGKPREREGRL
ncbi:MAG: UPF0175 family protein [Chloroflexi bacterium]|nr:UPF0175 family protein [Chloroflexota bacterium]